MMKDHANVFFKCSRRLFEFIVIWPDAVYAKQLNVILLVCSCWHMSTSVLLAVEHSYTIYAWYVQFCSQNGK